MQPRVDSSSSGGKDETRTFEPRGQSQSDASSEDVSGVGISNGGAGINL